MENISKTISCTLSSSDGIQIDFLANPQLQHSSLDYSAVSSHRSGISNLSYISMDEYLKTERIQFNKNSKFVTIPLIASS